MGCEQRSVLVVNNIGTDHVVKASQRVDDLVEVNVVITPPIVNFVIFHIFHRH